MTEWVVTWLRPDRFRKTCQVWVAEMGERILVLAMWHTFCGAVWTADHGRRAAPYLADGRKPAASASAVVQNHLSPSSGLMSVRS